VCGVDGYDPSALPAFSVGHSLGAKLHVLLSSSRGAPKRAGHVLVAFNNASVTDSVRLVERFAAALSARRQREGARRSPIDDLLGGMPAVGAMAERAARAAGIEFTPGPEETLEMASRGFESPSVTLVKFDEDDLDQNEQLQGVLEPRFAKFSPESRVARAGLEGNHLSPVLIQVEGSQLNPSLASLGGINIGDEAAVRELADLTLRRLRAP